MTLGEKIKNARKNAGLTQEQMAEKLMVSRPAVTKWESDKGIPDIENLKAISKLLNVSLDYLINEGDDIDLCVIREPIDLSSYGKGRKAKDKIVREKYPDAAVLSLIPEKMLTKGERVVDNLLGFFTDASFGIPDMINGVKLLDRQFYLAEKDSDQYLVTVSNEFIESRRMNKKAETKSGSKFKIGEMKFTVCKPID